MDDDDAEGAGKKRAGEDDRDDRGGKAAKGNDGKMKKQKGMNKGRKFGVIADDGVDICQNFAADKGCNFGDESVHPHAELTPSPVSTCLEPIPR